MSFFKIFSTTPNTTAAAAAAQLPDSENASHDMNSDEQNLLSKSDVDPMLEAEYNSAPNLQRYHSAEHTTSPVQRYSPTENTMTTLPADWIQIDTGAYQQKMNELEQQLASERSKNDELESEVAKTKHALTAVKVLNELIGKKSIQFKSEKDQLAKKCEQQQLDLTITNGMRHHDLTQFQTKIDAMKDECDALLQENSDLNKTCKELQEMYTDSLCTILKIKQYVIDTQNMHSNTRTSDSQTQQKQEQTDETDIPLHNASTRTFSWWDKGKWIPYNSAMNNLIISSKGQPSCSFTVSNGTQYNIDFKTMKQINSSTGFVRPIRCDQFPIAMYDDNGIWTPYEFGVSDELIGSCQVGQPVQLTINGNEYYFDFDQMAQTNLKTGTTRNICIM
jgi:WWE domain